MWTEIPIFLYFLFSMLLLPYGYNCLVLVYGALKYCQPEAQVLGNHPHVTVQLPVYNEKFVLKRLLNAVSLLEWPRDRIDVMILDDSTDKTVSLIDGEVKRYREKGLSIKVLRRNDRKGFKAGALSQALKKTVGEYIVLLDADFVPEPNFLRKTIPYLVDDVKVGFLQARWGHLNRHQNRFTEAFSIALDAHHMVDQAGRFELGLLMSFNGSAGVLRTAAIREVGGWEADTLSEDLDISYRMQLKGWKGVYLRDVLVNGEVPSTMSAFRTQQSRWAKGSTQCARKHLGKVWSSKDLTLFQKFQATIQLTNYSISLLMLFMVITEVMIMGFDCLVKANSIPQTYFGQVIMDPRLGILFTVCTFCTLSYYYTALKTQGICFRSKVGYIGFLALIGHGISAVCAMNILEGIFTVGGVFERIPKYDVRGKVTQLKTKSYMSLTRFQRIETILTVYSAFGILFAYLVNLLPIASYLFVYLAGFYIVSINI